MKEFLDGDVPLGPWNSWPIPELVQVNLSTLILGLTPQMLPYPRVAVLRKLLRSPAPSS